MEEIMLMTQKNNPFKKVVLISILSLLPFNLLAQNNHTNSFNHDTLLAAAKNIMIETRYCALITLDENGHPQARMMDAFPPEDDMTVWLGTNSKSRKVKEIRNDHRVTLYYEAPNAAGYVVIRGKADLVDDPDMKLKYWKQKWDRFYSDQKDEYLLIKVIPSKMEIIDYGHGISSKSDAWAVPYVEFKTP